MKLEVGQKIGIYEIVNIVGSKCHELNTQHLGEQSTLGVLICDILSPKNPYYYSKGEVRKVGSLIVKRLKVPEPPKH